MDPIEKLKEMSKPGVLKEIVLDITKPFEFDSTIQLNMLSLFIGANGSGKTFIMINSYIICEVAKLIIAGIKGNELIAASQYIIDKCFNDIDTTGTITGVFKDGQSISFKMEGGQIEDLAHENWEGVNNVIAVRYMSVGMRTFDDIKHYLSLRKVLMEANNGDLLIVIPKLLESYKLYDLTYIEGLIAKVPIIVDGGIRSALESFDVKDEITEFNLDLDKNDFYLVIDGKKKYLTTYGKGHQSIFNMTMGNV